MFSIHRRVFADQSNRESDAKDPSSSSQLQQSYNKRMLRHLFKTSPISCIMMTIVLVMFILCEVTDLINKKFNLAVISGNTLIKYGANMNTLVNQGQIWRLFTAMFLHAGVIHLMANSSSFFLYLMPVQKKLKNTKIYLVVLLFGGMLGNMLSDNVFNYRGKTLLAVGASTSICSVIGFDLMYRILRVNNQPLQTRRILVTLGYLFLISIMPGVDFFGHFGSLLGGGLIGAVFLNPSQQYWSTRNIKVIKIFGFIGLSVYTIIMIGLIIKYQN